MVTLGCGNFCCRCRCKQLTDTLGELSAIAGPVIDALALVIDGRRVGAGVIGAYNFDRTAVAGAILFDNNDAIVGLFARADARQMYHLHR